MSAYVMCADFLTEVRALLGSGNKRGARRGLEKTYAPNV